MKKHGRMKMAKFFTLFCSSITLSFFTVAAENENLLCNGNLEAEQVDFPEFWTPSSSGGISYTRTGGSDGKKAVVTLNGTGKGGEISIRQYGLKLAAGETYRISAYVKTKGFKCKRAGFVVHNDGWRNDAGLMNSEFPVDSEWISVNKTFKVFPSANNDYGIALFATSLNGELSFSDLKLEAVSEGAIKFSGSQQSFLGKVRLVPLKPLLNRIPKDNPELSFNLYGNLPPSPESIESIMVIEGKHIQKKIFQIPFQNAGFHLKLGELPCGDYQVAASVRNRETKEELLKCSYQISVINIPEGTSGNLKRLNNIVSEILNKKLNAASSLESFKFALPRDGWVFISLLTEGVSENISVKIDGSDTVINSSTDRMEGFRFLNTGEHQLSIAGNKKDSVLIVRSVPEIFLYPPCTNSFVAENGLYDWAFMKKNILYAVTTFNGGKDKSMTAASALGLKWLGSFGVTDLKDPLKVREAMEKSNGMIDPQFDGLTNDELILTQCKQIDDYTKLLWNLNNPQNRLIYSWTVGKPNIGSLHTDYISACLNASRGHGKILFEAYCHPQQDEKSANSYLESFLTESMKRFTAFFPDAALGTGMVFGNFNQIPVLTLEYNPEVDYKYYLDMQLNLIANNPAFENLACVGYWGNYYGDEELVRWSFRLMRHYAVEGRKDMLSLKYGFKYNPGFLKNCDFSDNLNSWLLAPSASESIVVQKIDAYGKNSQGRWGAGNAGDFVCVMRKISDKVNRISQKMEGLEVGKLYSLQFVTGDLADITARKYNPRTYGISAELTDAEIIAEKSFVHVDKRQKGRYAYNTNVGKINLNRIVFRAKSSNMTLSFNDEKALPGESLVINFIQLKPYYQNEN